MKKHDVGFTLWGFIGFFLVIAGVTTSSVFIYATLQNQGQSIPSIAACMLGNVIFGTLVCVFIDILRRKIMVSRPTEQILKATERIASGDFNVRLTPVHRIDKYDRYDVIMQNINLMAKELSQNEILKSDFVSNVSHEIKNPLSVIQNYATMLTSEKIDEKTRKEYVEILVSASKRLSDLVSNVLKLNKLEHGEINDEKTLFVLSELVRNCVLSFEDIIEKKGLDLLCSIDEISLTGNPSYVEIAVNNLLSNAIKFTEKGYISVTLKQEGNKAIIAVKDSGIGIDEEIKKHVFDKFYQGDSSRSTEGNGLGLALVKKITEKIGGEISVDSEVGKGSEFTLKLSVD